MGDAPDRLPIEDLEAMRAEFGLAREQLPGGGLPFNLRDDLKQVQQVTDFGMSLEEWAKTRGVPIDYARALQRYLQQA